MSGPVPASTGHVRPLDLERMGRRIADAARTAGMEGVLVGFDHPQYLKSKAAVRRRHRALRRLADALAAQGGEVR